MLKLRRYSRTSTTIIGLLEVNGYIMCHTLERRHKEIPVGTYTILMEHSPKFMRKMPTLQNVPNRSHILIHSGNFETDTEGCILLGYKLYGSSLGDSRLACGAMEVHIKNNGNTENIEIIEEFKD